MLKKIALVMLLAPVSYTHLVVVSEFCLFVLYRTSSYFKRIRFYFPAFAKSNHS